MDGWMESLASDFYLFIFYNSGDKHWPDGPWINVFGLWPPKECITSDLKEWGTHMMLTLFCTDTHTHTCTGRQAPPCFLSSHNQTLPSPRRAVGFKLTWLERRTLAHCQLWRCFSPTKGRIYAAVGCNTPLKKSFFCLCSLRFSDGERRQMCVWKGKDAPLAPGEAGGGVRGGSGCMILSCFLAFWFFFFFCVLFFFF